MSLREIESDRKPRQRLDNNTFSGWSYFRRFSCPSGTVDADVAAELVIGTVLKLAWGGVSTSNLGDPRLAAVTIDDKASGLTTHFNTTWISIDVSGAASTAFNLTTKTGALTPGQHETTKRIVGIAAATNSSGIPTVGLTDAGATPTLIADYVVRSVQIVEKWSAGRVLVIAEAAKVTAESTVYN